ncbi:MAG: hypothetical protein HC831_24220 [Chloroflexia bacterium]|nr:hypothetical protein [Chloroflexia bacterium]
MYRGNSIQSLAIQFVENRDEETFRRVINRLKPGLLGFAYKYMQDVDLAQEIISQVFMLYGRNTNNIMQNGILDLVYSIAKNECLGALRLRKRNISHEQLEENHSRVLKLYSEEVNMDTEVIGPSTDEIIESLHGKTLSVIEGLAEPYKTIMIEKEVNRKQLKAIASDLDMNLSTVKTRIRKARKEIAEILQKDHPSLVKAYYERDQE